MRFLLVIVSVAIAAVPSSADCRRRCVAAVAVKHEVAAVAAVAVPVYVPYAVQVPTYSAGYAQPAVTMNSTLATNYSANAQYSAAAVNAQQACDLCEQLKRVADLLEGRSSAAAPTRPQSRVEALEIELTKCRAELAELKRRHGLPAEAPAAQPQAVVPGKPPASAAKCINCHSEKDAAALGKNFVMFKGASLKPANEFTAAQQVKIITKTQLNEMPPKDNKLKIPQLSDEEAAEWVNYFKQ